MTARAKSGFETRLTINAAANDWGFAGGQRIPITILQRSFQDLLDSYLNSSALTQGQVPAMTGTDGVSEASGAQVFSSELTMPTAFAVEQNRGVRFGGNILLGLAANCLRLSNAQEGTMRDVIDAEVSVANGSNRPQQFFVTGGESELIVQPDDSQTITATEVNFTLTGTATRQVNAVTVRHTGGNETTNVRARIRYTTGDQNNVIFIPNRRAWETGTGGFAVFNSVIDTVRFDTAPFRLETGDTFEITLRGDSVAVQGNSSNEPWLALQQNLAEMRDMAYHADVQQQPFKQGVRVATTANITLSGTQTIDNVAVVTGDRVLVKDQTDASENGIYVVAASAWSRASDADTSAKVPSGIFVPVSEGVTDADTLWYLTTNDPITLDTTDLTFREFSGSMTTFNAPAITALSISGLSDSTPPTGTELGGARTLTYTVTNQSNVQGDLTFIWEGNSISTTVDPAAGTAAVTIPSTVTVAGTTYTGTLRGTNTQGATFERSVTFRSAQDQEQAYYGVLPTDTFASVDVSTLTAVDVSTAGTVYTINESAPNTQILGILSPADRDPVSIIDTVLSINSIADFTATTNVRTIGGQSYNLLTLTNNSGFTGTFNYTVTTE
jgi:hypothetical protein